MGTATQVSHGPTAQTCWSHHKSLKIRPPPLSQTITDLPVVIHTVGRVKLAGFGGRGQAVIQPPLQPVDLVFTRLEIIPGPVMLYREQRETALQCDLGLTT